jgi:hypothetical protein
MTKTRTSITSGLENMGKHPPAISRYSSKATITKQYQLGEGKVTDSWKWHYHQETVYETNQSLYANNGKTIEKKKIPINRNYPSKTYHITTMHNRKGRPPSHHDRDHTTREAGTAPTTQ